MNERQKRLIKVYEYLRRYYGIHTKTGFAESLHYGRTSMSAAMNGDEKYLTDKLFAKICEVYPGVFNLDYLLTGDGSLLADTGIMPSNDSTEELTDQTNMYEALLRSKEETIEELRGRVEDLKQQVADLRQQVALMTKKEPSELPVEYSVKM